MPYKAKRPCKEIGCPNTIREGQYCQQHTRPIKRFRQKDTRESSFKRGYNTEWYGIRKKILTERQICEICNINKARHVHHIPDYVQGTSHYNYDYKALCQGCHNRVTTRNK